MVWAFEVQTLGLFMWIDAASVIIFDYAMLES